MQWAEPPAMAIDPKKGYEATLATNFGDIKIQLFPEDAPRFLARTPHGYHQPASIRADLMAAGFENISIETIEERSKAASPRDVAIAYCQGTPLRNEIDARNPSRLQEATEYAARAIANRFGDGPVDGKIRALVVTAVR